MAVYEILEEIIGEKGLSVADVARICNLPDSTVRGIIRRKQETIALEVAFKLSDGLGVSLEKLNGMPEKESCSGAQKSPSAAEAALGGHMSMEDSNRFLVSRGFIQEGQDLSADDLAFLSHIIGLLDAWFEKHK